MNQSVNVKHEERSPSPRGSRNRRSRSMSHQSPRGSGRNFRERSWQRDMSDEEFNDWITYEYERRNPRNPASRRSGRDYSIEFDNPLARSTGNRRFAGSSSDMRNEPSVREPRVNASTSREQSHRIFQNEGNVSQTGLNKMFKVEPFPRGVKSTDQLQEWNYWLCNFEMAIEKAGIVGQRPKAIELSLHIGEEMRRIIIAKGMMPSERSVDPDFPFYENVTDKMECYFRSLTDESVDVAAFNSLKQGERETALEFEFRLQQLAKRMKETNPAMIKTRYIEGLRDVEIRNRAFVDGISLQDTVKMATRKEALSAKFTDFLPWQKDERSELTVSAVEQRGPAKRFERRNERQQRGGRQGGYSNAQQERDHGRRLERSARDDGERCGGDYVRNIENNGNADGNAYI